MAVNKHTSDRAVRGGTAGRLTVNFHTLRWITENVSEACSFAFLPGTHVWAYYVLSARSSDYSHSQTSI